MKSSDVNLYRINLQKVCTLIKLSAILTKDLQLKEMRVAWDSKFLMLTQVSLQSLWKPMPFYWYICLQGIIFQNQCFWWRIMKGGFPYVTCLQSFLKLKPKTTPDATHLKKRRSVFEDWITQTQHWVNRADWARHTRRSNRVKAFLCWFSFENLFLFEATNLWPSEKCYETARQQKWWDWGKISILSRIACSK